MVKVSIQITSTNQADKKVTDKIAYINPEATNEQLTTFARMLMNLSDNQYMSTTKITEEGID